MSAQQRYTDPEISALRAQLREGHRLAREEIDRRLLGERFLSHRLRIEARNRTALAEKIQRDQDRQRHEPVALMKLAETADRDASAAKLLFEGLNQHYMECLMAGRIDVWAEAARNIVELLSSPMTKVHKRSDLVPAPPRDPVKAGG